MHAFRPKALLPFALLLAVGCASSDAPDEWVGSADPSPAATSAEALRVSSRSKLHAIQAIADQRRVHDAELARYLADPAVGVVTAALVALGRIGDASYLPEATALLGANDPGVRAAAAFALGLVGGDAARLAVVARLPLERDPGARVECATALGRLATAADVPVLEGLLASTERDVVQGAAAEAIGVALRSLGTRAAPLAAASLAHLFAMAASAAPTEATQAAFALASVPGTPAPFAEAEARAAFRAAAAGSTRAYLARVLRRTGAAGAIADLVAAVGGDPELRVRAEAARQLARVPLTAETGGALLAALRDPSAQVAVAALETFLALGKAASAYAADVAAIATAGASPWLRAEALAALAAIDASAARGPVDAALAGVGRQERLAAVRALATLAADADLVRLVALLGDADLQAASAAAESLASVDAARLPASVEVEAALRAALGRADVSLTMNVAAAASALGLPGLAPDLAGAYAAFGAPTELDVRVAIVTALGELHATAELPVVEAGLLDEQRSVVVAATAAYEAITGTAPTAPLPVASTVTGPTPPASEIDRAVDARVALFTSRGLVVVRMLPEAALTATNFVRLVRRGFYDGTTVHRVVPNFVAQGGDPRGDGNGGSDRLVREEISRLHHTRGTLGMATSGKDTASSQFFVNHGFNVHLDGAYTVFAEVTFGMNVAEALEIGDTLFAAVAF